jgi:hypothetical protein
MPYRREVFVEQGPLVDRFVRHLIHHRSLKPWLARTKVKSPFWGTPAMLTCCRRAIPITGKEKVSDRRKGNQGCTDWSER